MGWNSSQHVIPYNWDDIFLVLDIGSHSVNVLQKQSFSVLIAIVVIRVCVGCQEFLRTDGTLAQLVDFVTPNVQPGSVWMKTKYLLKIIRLENFEN